MSQPLNFPIYLSEDRNRDAEGMPLATFFWALLAVTTVLRLIYAIKLPLTGDEAYFWEWARHPALGFYDHPPMAGWILWATRLLFGDTVLAVRLPAVLAGTFINIIVYRFAFDLTGSRRAASFTGILAMALPLLSVLGVLYSTDTPLLAAGTLGGYLFYLAVEKNIPWAWAGAGVCFAVIFTSKFLGVGLLAACFLYLAAHPPTRRHLKTPWPYLAFAAGLTGLIPVVLWNANHDWATFTFNLAARHDPPSFGIRYAADYLAGQAVALSPVVLFLSIPLIAKSAVRLISPEKNAWQLPALMAGVPLAGFFALSFFSKIGLHWPGVGIPFLAVALCTRLWQTGKSSRTLILLAASAWFVTVMIFLLPLLTPLLPSHWEYPFRSGKISSAQLQKYTSATNELGVTVSSIIESLPKDTQTFVFTRSYALSSLVAFYTPGHPEVTVLGGGSAHGRNHLFWFDPDQHKGENAVFVSYRPVSREERFIRNRFQRFEPVLDSGQTEDSVVSVIKCYDFSGKR